MGRRYSKTQRAYLYRRAHGKCESCGTPLADGWHADHDTPWSKGGATNVHNGRALCPNCNLTKGAKVTYRDTFKARPFQEQVIESVLDGIDTGRRFTIALGSPGTGKTLTYQAAATYLIREGLIDHAAVFVPRTSLGQQCEADWMRRDEKDREKWIGHYQLFDERGRLGRIGHVIGEETLPSLPGTGFVACYSSLTRAEIHFTDWAEDKAGRFLLVVDEAQFCGSSKDETGGGTKAGRLIEKIHGFSAHTLMLTGTPYRADNRPLVLADPDYYEPGKDGKEVLAPHVTATYTDGIEQGYLRRFEMKLHKGRITEGPISGDDWSFEYDLSKVEDNLQQILRRPDAWRPLVDSTVDAVRDRQRANAQYKGLISCIDKDHAREVREYLRQEHPGVRATIAVSADGAAGRRALEYFKEDSNDILITVRMAFIGYDCKRITVVGILTHYRHEGHLMQLVGRGLRTWEGMPEREQCCMIIAPEDSRMQEFMRKLQKDQDEGMRRREQRERDGKSPGLPGDPGVGQITEIKGVTPTGVRFGSNSIEELEDDEAYLFEAVKRETGSLDTVTTIAHMAQLLGHWKPGQFGIWKQHEETPEEETPEPEVNHAPPSPALTERQLVEDLRSRTAEEIGEYLSARGIFPDNPNYQKHRGKITAKVNKIAGCKGPDATTFEKAQDRLKAIRMMQGNL